MQAIIIDIDGTLADVTHRRHHLDGNRKDWDAFFAAMNEDPPIHVVCDMVEHLVEYHEERRDGDEGTHFFVCTGRPEKYRAVTDDWLETHCTNLFNAVLRGGGAMLMRSDDDHRSDVEIKREMLRNIEDQGFEVMFTVDDRKSVVEMWRSEGITCFQCAPGDWEEKPPVTSGTLHLMVGPSGAGKTIFCTTVGTARPQEPPHMWMTSAIVSTDALRAELNRGDILDQTKNQQVFAALRAIVKTRLEHGLDTVVDATNLRNRDRRALRDVTPRTSRIVYHVIDRPLADKHRDAGWRKDVMVKGQNLIDYHHHIFQANLKDILRGDGDQRVDVIDHRPEGLK